MADDARLSRGSDADSVPIAGIAHIAEDVWSNSSGKYKGKPFNSSVMEDGRNGCSTVIDENYEFSDVPKKSCNGTNGRKSMIDDAERNVRLHVAESGPKATFVDAAAMKEKVRQNLSKPKHTVTDYYHESGFFQLIARSAIFDKLTLAVIAFNAVWIAIDTDHNDSTLLLDADPIFIVAENFFCVYFSLEWFARFMSFKFKRDGLKDAWFVFDSFMVFMMVIETWVFTVIVLLFLRDAGGSGGNTGVMRLARLLRLSRMARMGKLLRVMPELMIMIKGMKAATRSVFFTLLLLVVIMYVFGIAFVQVSDGTEVGLTHFKDVPLSMYTLLIYGIFLDNVGIVASPLKAQPVLFCMFFIFVLIGALTVMNMLVGVLCEVVSAVAATEQEEMLVNYVHEKLSRVMAILDSDGGGTISKQEFVQILDNVEAVRCLSDVGVDVFALIDLADYIFEDDDAENQDDIELDFSRFMDVILQLRGSNVATVKDIVDLRKFMRLSMSENHKQTSMILEKLNQGEKRYKDLMKASERMYSTKQPEGAGSGVGMFESTSECGSGQDGSGRNSLVPLETADYKVEGGICPVLPHATPAGQLLSWIPIITSQADATGSATYSEDLSLKGNWAPFDGDGYDLALRIPAESDSPDESARGTFPAKEDGVCAKDVKEVMLVGGIPRLRIHSNGAFDSREIEVLNAHIDTMCKQLVIGMNDAIVMAGKSVERRLATKPVNSSCVL